MLISIVVVAVAIVGVVLWSQPPPEKIPVLSASISNRSCMIMLSHEGGDMLENTTFQIFVDGTDKTANFAKNGNPVWTSWGIGDTLTYTSSPCPPMPQSVQIIYTGGNGALSLSSAYFGTLQTPTGTTTTSTTTTTTTPVPPLPVTASFTGSPTSGNMPLAVQFTDESTGPVTSWSWTFGDGGTSIAQSPLYTYPNAGTYSVSLTVSNGTGSNTLTRTNYITVSTPAAPPTVSSAATNTAGTVITITFNKAMANPAGKQAEFKYQINGGSDQPFSAAALNADTTKIDLTTSGTAIAYGNTVTVNYTAGTVTAADTGVLATFTGQSVTNNMGAIPITAIGAITGTPQVGSVLTAGALTPSGATATYQWQRSLTSGGTYTAISGATSTTYTPVAGDGGYYIEVVATGTGSYTGTVTSAYVGPVTIIPVIEQWTASGTSTVPQGAISVEYCVVAGGGGGGRYGGGGGAAGFRTGTITGGLPVSYTITVGDGGNGATSAAQGSPGGISVFASITSAGGGGGGSNSATAAIRTGAAGGSGGGGVRNGAAGGAGNTPSVSPSQGNNGGAGSTNAGVYYGGGGGGAGGSGVAASGSVAGNGGAGSTCSINSVTYAGGGGGGSNVAGTAGGGGSGGGGAGGDGAAGTAGSVNTGGGGGGGGSGPSNGGNGGSGIVILRYY